jgi:hypothetical protein
LKIYKTLSVYAGTKDAGLKDELVSELTPERISK